jgi:DNA-binding PucR family transcriptional regulator
MLTLREALRLPCFAQARVVAGEHGLDRIVRRVHVVDIPDAQYGWGEDALVLTAGYGLRDSPARQEQLVPLLVERGLSGMVFSVGWYFEAVPPEIKRAADEHDFAVIETPPEVQFVSIVERLYSEIVQGQVIRGAREAARYKFAQELLSQEGPVTTDQRECAYISGFSLDKPYHVMVVPVQENPEVLKEQVESWLRGHGQGAFIAAREMGIAILVEGKPSRTGRQFGEQLVSALDSTNAGLRVGVSEPVAPYQGAKDAFAQALEAALIAKQLQFISPVVEFSELGMLDWLYHLPPDALRANVYWKKINALAEHDARTGADLLPTLEMHLEHGGALAEAAAELKVHRNTLLYRLGRIQEFLSSDLKNVSERLNLHVAMKAYRLRASDLKSSQPSPPRLRAE